MLIEFHIQVTTDDDEPAIDAAWLERYAKNLKRSMDAYLNKHTKTITGWHIMVDSSKDKNVFEDTAP